LPLPHNLKKKLNVSLEFGKRGERVPALSSQKANKIARKACNISV
jgi:hypothetical protein